MITWRDVEVKRQQYEHALREAELQRLVKLAEASGNSEGVMQVIQRLVSKLSANQSTQTGGHTRLADRTA